MSDNIDNIDAERAVPEEQILTFSDLIQLNSDIERAERTVNRLAVTWGRNALALEDQVEMAEDAGQDEKAEAMYTLADKTRTLAERIDGGETIDVLRDNDTE